MGLFSFLKKSKSSTAKSASRRVYPVPVGAPAADAYAYSGRVDDYFAQILQNCFPGYEIQRSTSVRSGSYDSCDWGYFLLIKNDVPKAAVFLVDKHQWQTQEIADAIRYCKQSRIPCVRFIRQFRNQAGYVVERINGVLR